MKKILLLLCLLVNIYAAQEMDYVTPKIFKQKSRVLLSSELLYGYGSASIKDTHTSKKESYNILAYTLINEHENLPTKHLNYNYETTLYHSKSAKKYDAFRVDAGLGYNIIEVSKEEYISLGVVAGYSSLNAVGTDTQQKRQFYKLGVRISFAKALFKPFIYAYGNTNYSQTNRDETFNEAKIGMRLKLPKYTNFTLITGVRYDTDTSLNYFGLSYAF